MHSQAIMRLKLVEKDMSRIEECLGRYSLRKFPKAYIMANCADLQEGLRNVVSAVLHHSGTGYDLFL